MGDHLLPGKEKLGGRGQGAGARPATVRQVSTVLGLSLPSQDGFPATSKAGGQGGELAPTRFDDEGKGYGKGSHIGPSCPIGQQNETSKAGTKAERRPKRGGPREEATERGPREAWRLQVSPGRSCTDILEIECVHQHNTRNARFKFRRPQLKSQTF